MLDGRWREAIETGGEAERWPRSSASTRSAPTRSRRLARRAGFRDPGGAANSSSSPSSWPRPRTRRCLSPVRSTTSHGVLRCRPATDVYGASSSGTTRPCDATATSGRRGGPVASSRASRTSSAAGTKGRLEHAEAVLAYVEAGTPHYFESYRRLARAFITFARGDDRTFAEDIDRSPALAAKATDPQATAPVAAAVAGLRAWCGDLPGARHR